MFCFSPGPFAEIIRESWPGLNLVITGEGLSHLSLGTKALNPKGAKVIDSRQPLTSVELSSSEEIALVLSVQAKKLVGLT